MKKIAMMALRGKDLAEAIELHEAADFLGWVVQRLGYSEVELERQA